VRIGDGVAGKVALERRTVHESDLAMAGAFSRWPLIAGEGFVSYVGVPLIVKGKVLGVLDIFQRSTLEPDSEWLDFLDALAGQAAIAIDNSTLYHRERRAHEDLLIAYDATIEGWSRALDLRDRETEGHTVRVTEVTLRLARTLGVPDDELVTIRRGALLHDIGKVGIPDSILLKPGPLDEDEWRVMRLHPQMARDLLWPVMFLREALAIPYCHHEMWDGKGYPQRLKGISIPLPARIFAVVDIWDALRSDRPYRKAWPDEQVLAHIRTLSGKHFDPQIAEAFLHMLDRE
jgi:HD-GYP domain-containing protein (c-di-GMP phosphodiesterase class II)